MGKTVAAAGDIRGPFDKKEKSKGRETILGIAGGDAQYVNRKGRPSVTTELRVRILMAFNELEDARTLLLDGKGATASRLRALKTTQSFAGREDRGLEDRLHAELSGIALWALEGLARLRRNGEFTMNAATQMLRDATKQTTIADFLSDVEIKFPAITTEVFTLYKEWCKEREQKTMPPNWFASQMQDAAQVEYTSNARFCRFKDCENRHRFFFKSGDDANCLCPSHRPSEKAAF